MVSPSEKKVLMRQEAESKLLAQANASRDSEPVRLVKLRSGKGKAHRIFYFQKKRCDWMIFLQVPRFE